MAIWYPQPDAHCCVRDAVSPSFQKLRSVRSAMSAPKLLNPSLCAPRAWTPLAIWNSAPFKVVSVLLAQVKRAVATRTDSRCPASSPVIVFCNAELSRATYAPAAPTKDSVCESLKGYDNSPDTLSCDCTLCK